MAKNVPRRFGALDGLKHFFRRLFAGEQRGDGVREPPKTGRASPTSSEQESCNIKGSDSQTASIEDTKAAMAKMRPKMVARHIDLLSFTTSAKNIARQFSASRKNKSADAWFAKDAYCLLEFGEWVCLLSKSDSEVDPDEDVYCGGLLGGMTAELSDDVLSPL